MITLIVLALVLVWALGSRYIVGIMDAILESEGIEFTLKHKVYVGLFWPFLEALDFTFGDKE